MSAFKYTMACVHQHIFSPLSSFLWKETRFPKDDVRLGTGVKVFTWTGRNNYVVQSDDDFISVGGGRCVAS